MHLSSNCSGKPCVCVCVCKKYLCRQMDTRYAMRSEKWTQGLAMRKKTDGSSCSDSWSCSQDCSRCRCGRRCRLEQNEARTNRWEKTRKWARGMIFSAKVRVIMRRRQEEGLSLCVFVQRSNNESFILMCSSILPKFTHTQCAHIQGFYYCLRENCWERRRYWFSVGTISPVHRNTSPHR